MKNLCFAFLGLILAWAAHAPLAQSSEAYPIKASVSTSPATPQKERFWKRLTSYVQKPLDRVRGFLRRLLQSDQDLIRLLIIILIVALIVSILVWLLPWPLDVIIMVLALVVALIFLLRYL